MALKEEGYAMETKPAVTRYPLCRALGIVSYPKGEPRVLYRDLKAALPEKDFQKWCKWAGCITQDNLGIYAWDVEDFLAGRPNND